ncbi:MAG: hypothetical protein IJY81_08165 [Lachnospiraceae bacterium]|nr:hypothetical protein [Lachnospiraceae bacterium]
MNKKQRKMLRRIVVSLALYILILILIKVFSISNSWIVGLLTLVPYLMAGYDILLKAFRNIKNGKVFDENFLMTLATFGAYAVGEFEEAVAVMIFYQVGELFQSYAVRKSRKSIADLMDICPETACVERDGEVKTVFPDEIAIGEIVVVKPGCRIPIDGIVVSGNSSIDTSSLTGEAIPKDVSVDDEVISGCINMSAVIRVKTVKCFKDYTVSKILELVENASSKKAPV